MNKKTRKLFTWCLVVSMILTQMLFTNVAFAANRNSGLDRYQTALRISQNFASADAVVIATGDDFADALCAAPLAYAKGATLLLTEKDTLTDGVLAEIQRLKAKTVYIVGGTSAVSAAVETAVKNAGFAVTRIAGNDRFETSVKIAEAVGTASEVALANAGAYADALSISSIAAFKGMPILLSNANEVPAVVKAYIGSKKVTAVGGSAVLSDAVVSSLGATRLAGTDRYTTNVEVLKAYADLSYANVYVATGEDFADALSGAVLAAETKSPVVLVGSALADAQKTFLASKMTKDSKVGVFGGVNAVSDAVASAIEGVLSAPVTGPVSVSSVKATAADSIQVAFSSVPADTSKVVFTVKRETTPITVTTSWNGSVATLKYSSKLPQGNYTVAVKNDAADLGTSNLTIDQEKVAKIEVTTDKFAVSSEGKKGYFTYKVTNQYGEDITSKNLASISWTVPGVAPGDVVENNESKGVIAATVPAGNQFNFLNLSSITITGVDTSANAVVSKTLSVSASVGTLSNMKLVDITNVDNKALQAGDATRKWNVTYEASDLAGNLTTAFVLLNGGLVDQDNDDTNGEIILSTSGYIRAKMINQSGKGVIELTVDSSADSLTTDVPVTVTAITKNGATSTLNLTLKKKSSPATFTIMAPVEDVSYGGSVEIPFVCYDADGTQLTDYDDVVTNPSSVTLSPAGLRFAEKADGNAKLMYDAPADNNYTQDQAVTLTATTNTGKFSSVSLNVRRVAKASTMEVSSMSTRLAPDAELAFDKAFFTAKDQYGRKMNLSQSDTTPAALYVTAEVTNGAQYVEVLGTGGAPFTTNNKKIVVHALDTAVSGGTATVKFSLMQNNTVVATKSVDFTVVKLSDIKSIKTDVADVTIYNTYDLGDKATSPVRGLYKGTVKVIGVDASGNTVILPRTQVTDNTALFAKSNTNLTTAAALKDGTVIGDANDFNKVQVRAHSDADDESAIVTVTTKVGTEIMSTSFNVKMSSAAPVSQSIAVDADEIDPLKYAATDKLKSAITVKDQYGKDMVERADDSVTFYLDGTKQADGFGNGSDAAGTGNSDLEIRDLAGHKITIVDNAGHIVNITVKAIQ